jgi:hypothetical protein
MIEQPTPTQPKIAPRAQPDPAAVQIDLLRKIEGHLSFMRSVLTAIIVLSIISFVLQACNLLLSRITIP